MGRGGSQSNDSKVQNLKNFRMTLPHHPLSPPPPPTSSLAPLNMVESVSVNGEVNQR